MTRFLCLTFAALLAVQLGGCARTAPPAPVEVKGQQGYYRAPAMARASTAADHPGTVTVVRGDTLYAIARHHNMPTSAIIEANGLKPPYGLRVGQRLILPGRATPAVQTAETSVIPAAAVRMEEPAASFAPPAVPAMRVESAPLAAPSSAVSAAPVAPPPTIAAGPATPAPRENAPVEIARSEPAVPAPVPPSVTQQTAEVEPASLPARAGRAFHWPLRGRVISDYGAKGGGLQNDGINIAAARGAPIRAAEHGVVVYAGNELRGFGNLLLVQHADGWMTAYGHADEILVARGDRVKRGQVVARVGATGNVTSPQLHFEIRRGSRAVNPREHLVSETASSE